MDQTLVQAFDKIRGALLTRFQSAHPDSYSQIFDWLIESLSVGEDWNNELPDPKRITVIDHGDYQGTKLFVVARQGYQPSKYWACCVRYGSCSSCDTFQSVRYEGGYREDGKPTEEQAKGYFDLALHMFQALTVIGD